MKEILGISGLSEDNINVAYEIPVKVNELKESIKKYPNHSVWELDLNTGKIIRAIFKEINYELGEHRGVDLTGLFENKLGGLRYKLIENRDCIYTTALNLDNAEKKFKRKLKKELGIE